MFQTDDSQVLFGFSEEIDWIPLRFVKPLPENNVCSACMYVSKRNCFLPCRCVLCEPCYQQCQARGGICALDGAVCLDAQVHWRDLPVDKIMKREVRCWNRDNGCEVVGDVSTMITHFRTTCAHHMTCCPKCGASVLRRDMIPHLQSRCSELAVSRNSPAPGSAIPRNELELLKTTMKDVKHALENATREDDGLREKVAELVAVHQDSRCRASSEENGLKEIKDGLSRAEAMMTENSKLNQTQVTEIAAFKSVVNEGVRAILIEIEKLRRCTQDQVERERTFENGVVEKLNEIEKEIRALKQSLHALR